MKVHLARHYGFCFGVRDAIEMAERLSEGGPATVLGELVHNPVVRERLAARGVREGRLDAREGVSTSRVMITAHGASDTAKGAWRGAGFRVTDGTCPLVHKAHDRLRSLVAAGYAPVVIGKPGHVEVEGLTGDFPGSVVVESAPDLRRIPASGKIGVIAQTTQPVERVRELVSLLRTQRPGAEVRFCDTVCRPTKARQEALRELLRKVDAVVVVGGRNSNNTRKLAETAEAAGVPARHVERAEEVKAAWFEGIESVGVTGGTSTLPETVRAVYRGLLAIAAEQETACADSPAR